jgi:hypothetical protein
VAKIEDSVSATVDCRYSNIGEEWCAVLLDENGRTLKYGKSSNRADALRNLADAIDDQF